MKTALSIITAIFFVFTSPEAKNIYISSSSGNDSNTGMSQNDPWKSLEKLNSSWDKIFPGDSVLFKRGDDFSPSGEGKTAISLPEWLEGGKYLVFGAYSEGEKPVIGFRNGKSREEYSSFKCRAVSRCIFQDLELRSNFCFDLAKAKSRGIKNIKLLRLSFDGTKGQAGLYFYFDGTRQNPRDNTEQFIDGIEIGWCKFENNHSEDAVNMVAGGDNIHIHDCSFYNIEEEAIDIAGGKHILIERNIISGTSVNGIKLHSQYGHISEAVIRFNLVMGSKANAIALENLSGCEVYNNLFSGAYTAYLGDMDMEGNYVLFGSFENNRIFNNIFHGCVQIGGTKRHMKDSIAFRNKFQSNLFWLWPGGSDVLIRYWVGPSFKDQKVLREKNIYIRNFLKNWPGSKGGDLALDPKLVSPWWENPHSYGDFHLRKDSPCIKRGTGSFIRHGSPEIRDLDGKILKKTNKANIGPYE